MKRIVLLLSFACLTILAHANEEFLLTYDQCIKDLTEQLNMSGGANKNKLIADFANDLASDNFSDELEYLKVISALDKYTRSSEPYYLDVQYTFGNLFQTKKKFKQAYPFFYRISLERQTNDQTFHQECLFYEFLGLNYYYFRRFNEAEQTLLKGLECGETSVKAKINIYNTLGLIYVSRKELETAERHFRKALKLATESSDEGWSGVVTGNLGDVFYAQRKYKEAHEYLTIDFEQGMKNDQVESAINALSLLVRVDLAMKNQSAAYKDFKSLDSLAKLFDGKGFMPSYLMAKIDYLKSVNDYKGAFESYEELRKIQNEANRERDLVNIKNTEFQFEFERKQAEINLLKESKKVSETRMTAMWFAISSLLIGAIITIWQIAKRRRRDKELLQLKNEQIQIELKMSERELRNVLRNLMEKNTLISDLNEELTVLQQENSKTNTEQEALTKTLQSFTLLTEEDWVEFKRLFEKCYIGFFDYFNENFEDITNAEMRLAALIKLDLENLEMSNALGISPDSVRKTNLRLRKRLGIQEQKELQKFIRAI